MAICPKCKKEIEYLDYTAVAHTSGTFQIEDKTTFYDEDWFPSKEAELVFECPECNKELFTSEYEAADFLTGVRASCLSGQV